LYMFLFFSHDLVFSWFPGCLACSIHIFLGFFLIFLLFDLIPLLCLLFLILYFQLHPLCSQSFWFTFFFGILSCSFHTDSFSGFLYLYWVPVSYPLHGLLNFILLFFWILFELLVYL
jgi:hypothetical protein